MSFFPDCRHDDFYNEDFLSEKDKEFVRGFDWCLEMAVDNFFDNNYDWPYKDEEPFDDPQDRLGKEYDPDFEEIISEDAKSDGESSLEWFLTKPVPEEMRGEYEWTSIFLTGRGTETRMIETFADYIRKEILDWVEMERDELITSMIDNMDEEEYKKNRRKAIEENKKSDNPKEYYDSRRYAFRDEKVFREEDE